MTSLKDSRTPSNPLKAPAYAAGSPGLRRALHAAASLVLLLCAPAAFAQSVTLAASSVEDDTATLTLSNHSGDWYYKYTSPTGGSCSTDAVSGGSTSVTGLVGNTSYTYKAYAGSGCTSELAEETFLTKPAKPSKPTATAGAGSGKITLGSSITGGSGALTRWEYTTDDGVNWSNITTETDNSLSYVVSGLTDGTDYTFKVRARNATGAGPKSDGADAVAPYNPTPQMGTPSLLGGVKQIAASWNQPSSISGGIGAYRLQYRKKGNTEWTAADASAENGNQNFRGTVSFAEIPAFEGGDLDDSTTYEVRMRVGKWDGGYNGWGTWSDIVEEDTLGTVTLTAGEVTETSANLTLSGGPSTWSYQQSHPSVGSCSTASSTTAELSDLTGNTQYTYKAFTGANCDLEIASETFSTVGLTAGSVTQTTASLMIANHTAAWWYQGDQSSATCTSVQANTATVNLVNLNDSTEYTYTAYDTANCNAADKIADASFTTPAPITFTAGLITEKSATLMIANQSGSWHYKRTAPTVGNCTAVASGQTVNLSNLTAGQSYTYQAFSDSTCTSGNKIGEEAFTTIDFAFVSKTNTSATLQLNHYPSGQQWWYDETYQGTQSCTATNDAQITVTGLTKNTSHTFYAYRAEGCASGDKIGVVDMKTTPAYALFADDVGQTSATLRLTNVNVAWRYQRTKPADTTCHNVAQGTSTVEVSGLTASTSYTYWSYRASCDESQKIDLIRFATLPAAPPSKPTATVAGATSVTLSWAADSGGSVIDKWQYIKKEGDGAWETVWTDMSGSGASTTSYTVIGLKAATAYRFKVRANNTASDGGGGAASPESDSVTTSSHSLTASEVSSTGAKLTITNWSGDWHYKYTSPTGGSCSTDAVSGGSTSVTGLVGNTSYTYKAYADSGCTSELAEETFLTKPAKPSKPTATAGAGSGKLTLSATLTGGSGALAKWQYTADGGASWNDITTDTDNSLSHVVSGLTDGTDYTFKVRAENAAGTGPASEASDSAAPVDVTLSATGIAATTATLTIGNWSPDWHYKADAAPYASCSSTAASGNGDVSLTGLTANASYTFSAHSDSGCSTAALASKQFTTLPPKAATPTVSVGNLGTGKVKVSSSVTGSATLEKWEYQKSENGGAFGSWTDLAVTSTSLEHTFTGLTDGTDYTFKVRAKNSQGYGAASDQSAAAAPRAISLASSEVGSGSAKLTITNWSGDWHYKYTSPTGGSCSTDAVSGGSTSVTGLVGNTSYTYKAYADSGCTSELAEETFLTKPAKPSKPTATAGAGSGKLTLSATLTGGSGALAKWQYTADGGASWNDITTDTDNSLSHVVSGLTDGTDYTFKVRAENAAGTGPASEASDSAAPVDVTLTASSVEHASAKLTIGNHSGDWHYKYTSPTGGSCSTDAVSGGSTSVTGLVGNTSYTYKAYADSGCTSELAEETFLTKPAKPSKPTATAGAGSGKLTLSATLTGGSGALAKWQYTADGGASWNDITTDTDNSLSHVVSGLTDGTDYTFKVRAENAAGTGPASEASDSAAPVDVTLSATGIAATTATLTIGNWSPDWHYKADAAPYASCSSTAASGNGDVSLTGLTANASYTFSAHSDSGCSTAALASKQFTTLPPKAATPTVSVGNLGTGKVKVSSSVTGSATLEKWEYQKSENGGAFGSWTDLAVTSTSLEHTFTGLTDGTDYTFKVRAKNSQGYGAASDQSAAAAPRAISLASSEVGSGSAKLTITNWSGDWHYKYTSPTGGSCSTDAVSGGSTSVTGLVGNTSYTYKAYADSGCTSELAEETFLTKPAKPSKPTATAGAGSGKLTLSATLTGGSGALAKWQYTADGGASWNDITTDTDNSLSHVVSGLTDGTDYTFKVRAENAAGTGPASEASDSAAPVDVTLTASSVEHASAKLTIGNHSGDWHYKYTSPTGGSCSTDAVSGGSTSVTGLVGNTSYTYKAYADSGCTSELAEETFLTKPAKPSKPTATAGAGSGKLTLSATLTGGSGALAKWQYTADGGASWNDITTDTDNSLSHVVSGLTDGTDYTFKVRAENAAGTGPASEASDSAAPVDVTLSATGIAATTATLTIGNWSPDWHYKADAAPYASCSSTAASGNGDVSLTGLTANASYTFSAHSDSGCSTAALASKQFTTLPPKAATPTVSVGNLGTGKVKVSSSVTGSATLEKWEYQKSENGGAFGSWTDLAVTSTSLEHTFTGLTDGTDYTFKVRAKNSQGYGAASDQSAAAAPRAISLASSEVGSGSAKLTITNWSGDWHYKYTSPTGGSCSTDAVSGGSTSVTGLVGNTSYTYKAYADSGCTSELAEETFLTKPAKPSKPTATAGAGSGKLTLSATLTGGSGALAKWQYTADGGASWNDITTDTDNSLSHVVSGLTDGTDYTFKVRAENAAGTGPASEASDSAAPVDAGGSGSVDTVPKAPSRPTANADDAQVALSWISGGDGGSRLTAWQYRQRVGEGDWGEWTDICRTEGDSACPGRTGHSITGLVNGASYRFQVRAVNALGNGAESPESAAAVPTAGTDLTPTFGTRTVADLMLIVNQAMQPLVLPKATGGDGDLGCALSPELPTGLSFDAPTRTLSGTPTAVSEASTYSFSATDADGDSVSLAFKISVQADLMPSFGDALVAYQNYQQTIPIEALTLPAASGGDGDLTYSLSPAPPQGLSFDPTTRVLRGTPTSAAPATVYSYRVIDSDETDPDSAVLTFVIAVAADEVPGFVAAGIPDLYLLRGQAMEPLVLPRAAGGNGDIFYMLGPELPEGLTFDIGSRVLSGVPSRVLGPVEMEYRATDSDPLEPDEAMLSFSIQVVASEEDRVVLNDALAAQGRALLSSATGVIGERFRAPAALSTGEDMEAAALSAIAGMLAGLGGGVPVMSGMTGMSEISGMGDMSGMSAMSDPFGISRVPIGGGEENFAGAGDGRSANGVGVGREPTRGAGRPDAPRAPGESGRRDFDLFEMLGGRFFAVSLGALSGKDDEAFPRWTVWGAADAQRLDGGGHDSGMMSLYIGADARFADGWLAGAALSRSTGESDYSVGGFSGTLETELTSLMPYIRGQTRSGLEVWAMGGFGTGEAEDRTDDVGAPSEASDLEMTMFAAGLRHELAKRGSWQFSLVGGGGYLSLETEGGWRAVDGLRAGVSQARLGLEVSHLSASLSPYLWLGARGDGGDGDSGAGLEVLAGVRHAGEHLDFEAQARWLAMHSEENYEEFGGMARLELRSRPDGSGLRLSLAPGWGETGTGMLLGEGQSPLGGMDSDRLLRAHAMAAGRPSSMSMDGKLGYGFALDRGLLSLDADHSSDHWTVRQSVGASWESLRSESEAGNGLRFRLGYEIPNLWTEGGPQFELNFSRKF